MIMIPFYKKHLKLNLKNFTQIFNFDHISRTYGVKKFKTDQKSLFLQIILKIIIHKFTISSRTLQKF